MKHLIFKTVATATGFNLEVVSMIDFVHAYHDEHGHDPDMELIKITYHVANLMTYPKDTVFISTNSKEETQFSWLGDSNLTIMNQKALYLNDTVMINPVMPESKPVAEELLYLFEVLLDGEDRAAGEKKVRSLAKSYAAYSYVFDVEAIINPPVPASIEEASKTMVIKDFITKKYPCPKKKDIGFSIDPDIWNLLIRNYLQKECTLIIGPTGSGKTEIVSIIAKQLGINLHIQDMGTVHDAQSALLGVHRIGSSGTSEFDYAPFVSHIQEEGLVLLDELSRSPLAANNILFPCLDRRRYLPVDIADTSSKRHIPVHEGCVFFATANIGSEYSGTHSLDRALMDRFFPVELDFPSESDESDILVLRTGVDKKSAGAIVKVSYNIRQQFKSQELSNTISVRHTLQIASLIHDGFAMDKALSYIIMPLFEDSVGCSEKDKIKTIIAAY